MIVTKRYDYIPFDSIHIHPHIANHRPLDAAKVRHYADDIQRNGLLEPLIVWERNHYEFFLVGGFHRVAAITAIREKNPGYFDRVDVRVVSGEPDEMRALNLKLNADRLDAKLTDYFDSVVYLNNANWSREQIAEFLDKPLPLIEEILRFVPTMDKRLRRLLEENKLSWSRCKTICRDALAAEPGHEKTIVDAAIAELEGNAPPKPARPLTMRKAVSRLTSHAKKNPSARYSVTGADLLALLLVLKSKNFQPDDLERARAAFPGLIEDE